MQTLDSIREDVIRDRINRAMDSRPDAMPQTVTLRCVLDPGGETISCYLLSGRLHDRFPTTAAFRRSYVRVRQLRLLVDIMDRCAGQRRRQGQRPGIVIPRSLEQAGRA